MLLAGSWLLLGSQDGMGELGVGNIWVSEGSVLTAHSSCPVNLLGLLKWRSKPSLLCGNLQKLMNVDGGEVIKVQPGFAPLPPWFLHSPCPAVGSWAMLGSALEPSQPSCPPSSCRTHWMPCSPS